MENCDANNWWQLHLKMLNFSVEEYDAIWVRQTRVNRPGHTVRTLWQTLRHNQHAVSRGGVGPHFGAFDSLRAIGKHCQIGQKCHKNIFGSAGGGGGRVGAVAVGVVASDRKLLLGQC